MREALIRTGDIAIRIRLLGTASADAIWNALPIYASVQTWGQEVYFTTRLGIASEPGAKAVMTKGEIAFWPEGQAIAIGFGPTPISEADEIRLAAPCNVWAHALDDVGQLAASRAGDRIAVLAADS